MNTEILNEIERIMNRRPICESNVITFMDYRFTITTYNANENLQDKAYIADNRQAIWDFFNDGYEQAGLGQFTGCFNSKSVRKNTVVLKVARCIDDNRILAMSIYTSNPKGLKCAGITIKKTDDENERALAKIALKRIVKEDIARFREYYWIECDGTIKRYWERYGGIKIPNSYLPAFLKESALTDIEYKDEYTYTRIIGRNTENEKRVEKCLFGFSDKEVLEKYIKDKDTSIEELVKYIESKQNESEEDFEDINSIVNLIDTEFSYDMFENWIFTITEYGLDVLKKFAPVLQEHFNKFKSFYTLPKYNKLERVIDDAEELLDCYTILKPYLIDEWLVCADSERFDNETNKRERL